MVTDLSLPTNWFEKTKLMRPTRKFNSVGERRRLLAKGPRCYFRVCLGAIILESIEGVKILLLLKIEYSKEILVPPIFLLLNKPLGLVW